MLTISSKITENARFLVEGIKGDRKKNFDSQVCEK